MKHKLDFYKFDPNSVEVDRSSREQTWCVMTRAILRFHFTNKNICVDDIFSITAVTVSQSFMDVDTIIPETIPITTISDKVMNRHSRAVRMPQKIRKRFRRQVHNNKKKNKEEYHFNRDISHQFNLTRTTRKEKIPC